MSAPRPSSLPGLPLLGHTLRFVRDPLGLYGDVAAECDDVARLRVLGIGEFYALTHPDHVERALTDREAFAKTEDFRIALGESVVATEGAQWRRQRDALEEFFYPAQVRSYADRMVDLTERRLDRWSAGERLSLHDEMGAVALDNLFGTLFDRPLDPGGDERLRRAANDLNLWFRATSFALPTWVPTPSRRRFRTAVEAVEREARSLLREAREGNGSDNGPGDGNGPGAGDGDAAGDDLLSTLAALRAADGTDLADAEIVDQVVGLTFAGHDTTALVLTYALHHLGTHDAVRDRFHAELDAVLDGPPTLADVGDLDVTRRVVHETMRAYPPVHTIPRETTRAVEMGGYRLRAGTRTHLGIWGIHRDGRFWTDPASWRPSRWRTCSPESKGSAYLPFGAGPRTCLGRRFALLEATLVLAAVGRRYVVDPERPLAFDPMVTTQPAHGVPARVRSR
ncbi:MAG: cytochrome P450 [Haloferacaceae archaeon]